MKERIKGKVTMGARVTALAIKPEEPNHKVEVSVAGDEKPRQFDHVITTLPFGCLRNVDTSGCFFHGICKQLSALLDMNARQRLPSSSLGVGGNKTI